ncbi:MAG: glycosyltransferase [Victivallales bacterium]|nr:glycosyltransferase [Victivallales bacterium]
MTEQLTVPNTDDFNKFLDKPEISSWNDISSMLDKVKTISRQNRSEFTGTSLETLKSGISFITFDYGIDGVSIEIEKYALCLEKLFKDKLDLNIPLHFIGGDFHDKADTVLKPRWNRFRIPDMNGWSKWSGGKWFAKLFYENMPEGSEISKTMSKEIWKQAVCFARQLSDYLQKNGIKLLIPVNICSNPGNPAIALAIVLVTEFFDIRVIASNHDYYWEGGKPERPAGEEKGPRDHFFKNCRNKEFFSLFERLYPWNGDKWIQVNINEPQTECLINKYGFEKNKVFEIGSCISNEFLKEYSKEEIYTARKKMNYILSGGSDTITPLPVNKHINGLETWMKNQKPIVCSFQNVKPLDLTNPDLMYCLQPTRIVGRKRIYKDLKLLESMLKTEKLNKIFTENSKAQLILHITGPVPIEHQADLEEVLNAYIDLCNSVSPNISERVFIAFSVGTEDHPALKKACLNKLCIEEIYRLADIILFPSETEGRGLPIIESGASGVPIICSRYYPVKVFDGVVGKDLPEKDQIKYVLFPEQDKYSEEMLDETVSLLVDKEYREKYADHNRKAVSRRYGIDMLVNKFNEFIKILN